MKRHATVTLLAAAAAASTAQAQSLFRAPMPQQPIQPPAAAPDRTQPASSPANGAAPAPASPGSSQEPASRPAQTPPPSPAPAPSPMPAPMAASAASSVMAAPSLDSIGLFVVQPTKPRSFQKHDKVDIIINEISNTKNEQTLDAKKDLTFNSQLQQFPSLQDLILYSTLTNGIGNTQPSAAYKGKDQFKGTGTYERKDRFTARIAAIVQDVKPNGLIFIEARQTIQSDGEVKVMVLSGMCDPKDITNANTVQSSQLANLVIRVEHQGDVKDTATKSWITRFFEDLFGP